MTTARLLHAHLRRTRTAPAPRHRGVAAVMAMMFLVIFGSLAAALAVVASGNLRTAEASLKINRTLGTADSGLDFIDYRLRALSTQLNSDRALTDSNNQVIQPIIITDSEVLVSEAPGLWVQDAIPRIISAFEGDGHTLNRAPEERPLRRPDGTFTSQLVLGPFRSSGLSDQPDFSITVTPHPVQGLVDVATNTRLEDVDYDRPVYQSADFLDQTKLEAPVTNTNPLDARFLRVTVYSMDDGNGQADQTTPEGTGFSPVHTRVYRSVGVDYMMRRTQKYAVYSPSRIMIGRNVSITGDVYAGFEDVELTNGDPIEIGSDFTGLDSDLDFNLGNFYQNVAQLDTDGDNRLSLSNARETSGIVNAQDADTDGDGFISDFDIFLNAFDDNQDGSVTPSEFEINLEAQTGDPERLHLWDIIDGFNSSTAIDEGSPWMRRGDGLLNRDDFYAKISGALNLKVSRAGWEDGEGKGKDDYQNVVKSPISPNFGKQPIRFEIPPLPSDPQQFDTSEYTVDSLGNDLQTQADTAVVNDPGYVMRDRDGQITDIDGRNFGFRPAPVYPLGGSQAAFDAYAEQIEQVPYGAKYPYDYYARPVYENLIFEDVYIPMGTNALFRNCRFIGTTTVEFSTRNTDENFNYSGMQNADGTFKHWDKTVTVNGVVYGGNDFDGYYDSENTRLKAYGSKYLGNNLRFHDCRFEGAVVSTNDLNDPGSPIQPPAYTHVRNKLSFTGRTEFDASVWSSDGDRADEDRAYLYRHSTLLLPNISVEMGTFTTTDPSGRIIRGNEADNPIRLEGMIVAGLIDLRGHVDVEGGIFSTYKPEQSTGPVRGQTSPDFNTTLGYFTQEDGDQESADLANDKSLGRIRILHDPTRVPPGLPGPVIFDQIPLTRTEGGGQGRPNLTLRD